MKSLTRKNELMFTVKTETLEEFFDRGRRTAAMLDRGETLIPRKIISFEDPKDLIKFLSEGKLMILEAVRKRPDSISNLAHKLHRSRAAIDKDVQLLEAVGIVQSEYVINPGHGRCRVIKPVDAKPIKLRVEMMM